MADVRFTERGLGITTASVLVLALLSCTSPTAPPPAGPNGHHRRDRRRADRWGSVLLRPAWDAL